MTFGSNPPEGGGIAGLQLMLGTVMKIGVMPGCTKICFSGVLVVEEKYSSSLRTFKPEQGFWLVISQQNSVSQKVQQNVECKTLLFCQEIKSLGKKKFPHFRCDQVILVQMLYIQMITLSWCMKKNCIAIYFINIHSFQQVC